MLGRTALGLTIALVGTLLAACSGTTSPPPSVPLDAIPISADNLAFSTDRLAVRADEPFTIAFDNLESQVHNVSIYEDDSFAQPVFKEEAFSGPRSVVYEVPALAAGTYAFRCDVHPLMKGAITAG